MSRFTPPERRAVRPEREYTPTDRYPVPPNSDRYEQETPNITLRAEVHRLRDEFKQFRAEQNALRVEVNRQGCDLNNLQSMSLDGMRYPSPPRKRWSDAPAAQRTMSAIVGALLVALATAAERYMSSHERPPAPAPTVTIPTP